jgi:hypothetical protein
MNSKTSGCGRFVTGKVETGDLGKETLNLFDTCKLSMVNEESRKGMIRCYGGRGIRTQKPPNEKKVAQTVSPEHETDPVQSCA